MSYKKYLLMKAVGKVAAKYGDKWAKKAGDSAVCRLSRMAVQRGWLDRPYDLQTLSDELRHMHRQGRFSAQEWAKVKGLLRQAWNERRKPR